jgi:hypothetical protein
VVDVGIDLYSDGFKHNNKSQEVTNISSGLIWGDGILMLNEAYWQAYIVKRPKDFEILNGPIWFELHYFELIWLNWIGQRLFICAKRFGSPSEAHTVRQVSWSFYSNPISGGYLAWGEMMQDQVVQGFDRFKYQPRKLAKSLMD